MTRSRPTRGLRLVVALGAVTTLGLGVGCGVGSTGGRPNPGDGGTNTPTGMTMSGAGGTSAAAGTNGGAAGTVGGAGTGGAVPTGTAGATVIITGAAGTSGGAGTSAAAGTTGGGAGTGFPADGGTDASGACSISITSLVAGTSLPGTFESGVQPVLRAHASVAGYGMTPKWIWSVSLAGAIQTFTSESDAGDTIDVKLDAVGAYEISARVDGAPQCNRLPVVATVVPPRTPAFLFRVTPPSASRLPVRETSLDASDVAGAAHTIDLEAGAPASVVSLLPTDANGFPLPSYVVVTNPSATFDLQGYTARGPFVTSLVDDVMYQVLVVPDGSWAPLLVSGTAEVLPHALSMTAGVSVTGTARDGAGRAVQDARVILRAGRLPSTVGVSDSGGAFAVAARANIFSATISPPSGAGLPEAHVAATPGIVVPPYVTGLGIDMKWAQVTAAPLTVTVRAGAGGALVVGAQVRAESSAEVSGVGTLTVHAPGGDVALTASGTARADAVTDANGVATLGVLPAGDYRLIVAPPAGASSAAITMVDVTLPTTGLTREVALAGLVKVTGALTGTVATNGAKVTAVDRGELAPATRASSTVDVDGHYTLSLSPDRTYELLVEPAPSQSFGLVVLASFTPGTAPAAHTNAIAAGLSWNGAVVGGGRPIGNAVVQVFCVGPSATCLDPSIALAQGTTAADGTLALTLPSPGP